MHEMSVCESLIRETLKLSQVQGADRVVNITLQIGPLSSVVPALLEQAFRVAKAQTELAESSLLIKQTVLKVKCLDCGNTSEVALNNLLCRRCDSSQTQLLSGDELLIESIEFSPDQDQEIDKAIRK